MNFLIIASTFGIVPLNRVISTYPETIPCAVNDFVLFLGLLLRAYFLVHFIFLKKTTHSCTHTHATRGTYMLLWILFLIQSPLMRKKKESLIIWFGNQNNHIGIDYIGGPNSSLWELKPALSDQSANRRLSLH